MKRLPLILAAVSAAAGTIGVLAWVFWPKPTWPDEGATLTVPQLVFDESGGVKRVYLDAGHGAAGNTGNLGVLGIDEQDFTLSLAQDVAAILTETGHFEIRVCREKGEVVPYAKRIMDAEQWRADVFVSLHSDVRSPEGIGYSVLWSDEGDEAIAEARLALARAMAQQLAALSLPAYGGEEYADSYAGGNVPGVFVDRHEEGKRIFVLRKPTMPSIIVETHNAKSEDEARRWQEPAVRRAFAHALALAVDGL